MTTTTWRHTLSGRTFEAKLGSGRFGAMSLDGHWDTGEAGTIWPAETLLDGTPLWSTAALGECPSTSPESAQVACTLNPRHRGLHVAHATGVAGPVRLWP